MDSLSSEQCKQRYWAFKQHGYSKQRKDPELKGLPKSHRRFKVTFNIFNFWMAIMWLDVNLSPVMSKTTNPQSSQICGSICIEMNSTLSEELGGVEAGSYSQVRDGKHNRVKYILYEHDGTRSMLYFCEYKTDNGNNWKVRTSPKQPGTFNQPAMTLEKCSEYCPQTCIRMKYIDSDGGEEEHNNIKLTCPDEYENKMNTTCEDGTEFQDATTLSQTINDCNERSNCKMVRDTDCGGTKLVLCTGDPVDAKPDEIVCLWVKDFVFPPWSIALIVVVVLVAVMCIVGLVLKDCIVDSMYDYVFYRQVPSREQETVDTGSSQLKCNKKDDGQEGMEMPTIQPSTLRSVINNQARALKETVSEKADQSKKIVKEQLGIIDLNEFDFTVSVARKDINLPCNLVRLSAICSPPSPPLGCKYEYRWADVISEEIPHEKNGQMKHSLETVLSLDLSNSFLELKNLDETDDEKPHRFEIFVTCTQHDIRIITNAKTNSAVGEIFVTSATSVRRSEGAMQCYGTVATAGITPRIGAPHTISQLPNILKSSVLYRIPDPLKQNESNFDITPTKMCDFFIAHTKHKKEYFITSLENCGFKELEQRNKVIEISNTIGCITSKIELLIWHRRIHKDDLDKPIYWTGPEKVDDAKIAIFVKKDFVTVEGPDNKILPDDSATFVAEYSSESSDFQVRWKTKAPSEREFSLRTEWNDKCECKLTAVKKGTYEINVVVKDLERDPSGNSVSEFTKKLNVLETSVTFDGVKLSEETPNVETRIWNDEEGYSIKEPFPDVLKESRLFRSPYRLEHEGSKVREGILIDIGNESDIYIATDNIKKGCCGWTSVETDGAGLNSNELKDSGFEKIDGLVRVPPNQLKSLWRRRAKMGEHIQLLPPEMPIAIFVNKVPQDM